MANRLQLDFSIESTEARTSFVNTYLSKEPFLTKPPTQAELETIANYILWGKNKNGLNVNQEKIIQLETRNKTWSTSKEESLEALIESPTFRESIFIKDRAPSRLRKEVFSREEARKLAPPSVLEAFEELWRQIDELDLIINFYDLRVGKRVNPPRDALLERFTEGEQSALQVRADKLNQFKYLKLRHLLVELRREQFVLRESYMSQVFNNTPERYNPLAEVFLGTDIAVRPIGLKNKDSKLKSMIFKDGGAVPSDFNKEELRQLSDFLWNREEEPSDLFFDFRELEHVYQLFQLFEVVEDATYTTSANSNLDLFINTLKYYVEMADLSELHKEILDLKIQHYKNQEIADHINEKYGKTYNANYISTIFRQKICASINQAAVLHLEMIHNLFFPENFKKCRGCGRTLLLCADNFVKKAKSKDGFAARCKKCDKIERKKAKEEK